MLFFQLSITKLESAETLTKQALPRFTVCADYSVEYSFFTLDYSVNLYDISIHPIPMKNRSSMDGVL
jgi:hypothetical protein